MYEPIRFSQPSSFCNLHFLSCLHLGHDREFIYGPRGFKTVHEHDRVMVERWKERVNKSDIVFLLGDNAFGFGAEQTLVGFLRTVPFWKVYISPGNHFAGWHQLYKKAKATYLNSMGMDENDFKGEIYPLSWKLSDDKEVIFMPNLYEIYAGKQALVLGHYPVYPHNGAAKGVWGVFGHCHGNNPETNPNTSTTKVVDVCVESFGGPVSYDTIERFMRQRTAKDVSHHTKTTQFAI